MIPIFWTSDWHIGHSAVIRFSNRPFKNIDHMHRVLINNYNSVVSNNGICYMLGDIGLTKGSIIKEVIQELNGTKILILGNHDKGKGTNFWLDCGFSCVLNQGTIYIQNERVTMTHCPLRGLYREDVKNMIGALDYENWHGERKQFRYSIRNEGQFHLHGHIHSPNKGRSKRILNRQLDVGVDANQYRPVSYSQVQSWIHQTLKTDN